MGLQLITPQLPPLTGEFSALSGPDQSRCKDVLRWLIAEGAIDATVALTHKPFAAVVHRSGWVSSAGQRLQHE